ncbi:MAG: tRNA lysidine(34) synthetase TilS [Candidatus Omnitrophota bacterium]
MMIDLVKKTIAFCSMFEPGERVVIGLSGGPDSVCLTHVLNRLNYELCLDLCVAHFDHAMRKNSARDCFFVEKLARSLSIPFFCDRLDWKKVKKSGSLEDFLKKQRYDFLLKICAKTKSQKIALGHTRDDQAETVLMRILRGSGLYGLSAILPKRAFGCATIVRPLIEVSRQDVVQYLSSQKIAYRTDKTNADNVFLRNKIRNKLLPVLEREYNPAIKKILSDLALNVGADYRYLQQEAEFFLTQNLKKKSGKLLVSLKELKKIDVSIQRLIFRALIEMHKGDLRQLTFKHWQEIEELLLCRPLGSQVHLPNDLIVSTSGACLVIFKR